MQHRMFVPTPISSRRAALRRRDTSGSSTPPWALERPGVAAHSRRAAERPKHRRPDQSGCRRQHGMAWVRAAGLRRQRRERAAGWREWAGRTRVKGSLKFATHGCDEAAKPLRLRLLGSIGKPTYVQIWPARQGGPLDGRLPRRSLGASEASRRSSRRRTGG